MPRDLCTGRAPLEGLLCVGLFPPSECPKPLLAGPVGEGPFNTRFKAQSFGGSAIALIIDHDDGGAGGNTTQVSLLVTMMFGPFPITVGPHCGGGICA